MKTPRKKILTQATIIVNPVSGKGDSKLKRELIKEFAKKHKWTGKYIETSKTVTAKQIAQNEVKEGTKHIIVCGGDGTVMEVLEVLLHTDVALGIIPLGTGNLLAKNLSLPLDIEEATNVAFFGNHRQIDVGKVNEIYFSIITGMGLDAKIMGETKREMKDKWGVFAYVVTTIKSLRYRSTKYKVTLDKKKEFTVKAKTILASNMGKIMNGIEVVPSADPQSGSLRLGIIKPQTAKSWINLFSHAFFGKIENSPHYDVYEAKHIKILSLNGKREFQADGNHFPATDTLEIEIYPKSLQVRVRSDVINTVDSPDKKVLLFDFDGTLADTLKAVITIYNSLAKKHKYPLITPQEVKKLRGMNAKEILDQLPIPTIKVPILYAEGMKEFTNNLKTIQAFPTMKETVEKLSKQFTLGIVTSNNSENVKKFLINHDMDFFDFIYSDKSVFGKGKIIKKVLKKYDFTPSNAIYIGDEVRDIEAAREAEIKIGSVTWGFNSKKVLRKNQPDFLIDTPKSLLEISLFKESNNH
jgi:phosphoglycolate phosphatase